MKVRNRARILYLLVALSVILLQIPPGLAVAAPAAPVQVAPLDGSAVTTQFPTVSWLPSAEAQTYAADIADNANFWGPQSSGWVSALSFTPPNPLNVNSLYYWRVKASGTGGTSPSSPVWRFWMPLTLVGPADGASVSLTPTLSWSGYKTGLDTATRSYRVQVSTDPAFASDILVDSTITSASFTVPSEALSIGQVCYWHVNVSSADGTSGWSDTRSFTTPLAPPVAPVLQSPANGSTTDTWQPELTWGAVDGASSYTLRVTNTSTGATSTYIGLTTTSYTFNTYNALGVTYQWKVDAVNPSGAATSDTWSFITPSGPPDPPMQVSPPDGSAITTQQPTVSWLPAAKATTYAADIADNTNFWSVQSSGWIAGTTFTPANNLNLNSLYYWRVKAQGPGGASPYSSIWRMWTPLTLVAPANGSTATSLTPTLSWNTYKTGLDTTTRSYRVQVSSDSTFATGMVVNATSTAASFAVPSGSLAPEQTYYWRANVSSADGTSGWSDTWSITTPQAPPPPPVQQYPANGSTIDNWRPLISWDASPGANSYNLYITNTSTGANTTVTGLTTTSYSFETFYAQGVTYHWRVEAVNGSGPSSSPTWTFTTPVATTPPTAPILLSPANTITPPVGELQPAFSWEYTSYTKYYKFELSTSANISSGLVKSANVNGTSFGPGDAGYDLTLDHNTVYYWKVTSVNRVGSSASQVWSFKSPPPPGPALASPGDGSTVDTRTPTLSWNAVTGALSYQVQIASDQSFAPPLLLDASIDAASGSSYTVPTKLSFGGTYYWRVNFTNSSGTSLWSDVWSVQGPPQPAGQGLIAPADGGTVDSRTPTLSWETVAGALTYGVQVATNADFAEPLVVDASVDAASGNSYTVPVELDYDATYYWRANFTNVEGTSRWSAVWTFQGPPVPLPAAPSPISPGSTTGGSITGFRPSFDWSDPTYATSYGFQLSADPSFSSRVVDVVGLATSDYSMTSDLSPDTTYYWRANAADKSGAGAWSVAYSFTTPPPPPAAPVLLAPPARSMVSNLRPHFDWTDSIGATSYTIEIYSDAGLTLLTASASVNASAYDPGADLSPNVTYYWRVQAANEPSGPGPWSAALSFTTPNVPAPAPPPLLSPANGAEIDSLTPILDWQSDVWASSYKVQVSKYNTFSTLAVNSTVYTAEYVQPSWSKLDKGTNYYWRVCGVNSSGIGAWSEVWVFHTPTLPGVPSLVSPSNGAVLDTTLPSLAVSSVPDATGYTFQLSTASWFGSPVVIMSLSPTVTLTSPLLYSQLYYWRANASNNVGTSVWSSSGTFTTPPAPAPPAAPALLTPADGTVVGTSRPALVWSDVTGATSYTVAWSKSSTFAWTEASRPNLTSATFTLDVDLTWSTQYYWRVKATGLGGDSEWSSIFGLKTPAGPPSLPVLLSPADGAAADSALQKLTWAAAADTYQVQLSTDPTFETTLTDSITTALAFTPASALTTGTTYYWRVKAINVVGDSGWTAPWSFVLPLPPGQPNLTAPTDGGTLATLTPTLVWDEVPTATSYEVWYSKSNTFAWGVTTATVYSPTYTIPSALPLSADYYWQVRASNGGGTGPWSSVWSFHTPAERPPETLPPATPNLLTPAGGAILDTVTPTFSWDPTDRAFGYHVQVFSDQALTIKVADDYTTEVTHTLSVPLNYQTLYYWVVEATNNVGATNSAPRSFTTSKSPPPPPPTLVSPADGDTNISRSPVFDWSDTPYATSYRIQVSISSTFNSTVVNATTSGSTYTMPAWQLLNLNTLYYWRVQAYNAQGAGDYSAAGSFTTLPPPPAPAIPSLVSPGAPDGGTIPSIDTLKPPFSWNAVPEATSYRIQISRNVGFTSLMINTTTTAPSYSLVAALTANAQYWWKVQAINSSGPGAWSTVYTFRTLPIPAAPILLSPANGATVSGVRPTLDWDDVPNATSYHLLVGTNSWFGTKVVDVVVTDGSSFTLDRDLVSGTTYYWKLTATNGVGTGGWSATWSFKVTAPPAPPALPALLSPADGTSVNNLLQKLDWADVPGTGSYQVQLGTDSAFRTPLVDTSVSISEFTPASPLTTGATYYWRVKAINGVGDSGWTAPWSFVLPLPPGQPNLTAPTDGGTLATLTPTLVWDEVPTATSYEVWYSKSNTFAWGVTTATVYSPTYTIPSALPLSADYYWQVRASNGGGTGPWSSVWSFHTPAERPPETLPPATPNLLTPAGGAILDTVTPTFSWDPTDRAFGYHVQVFSDQALTIKVADDYTTEVTHTLSVPLNYQTLYYWVVEATNNVGATNSAPRSFTTSKSPPPPPPTLVSPADGDTNISRSPVFDWSDTPYATSYRIQVSISSTFNSTVVNATTSGSTYTMPAWQLLNLNTLYYWRVQAYNAQGAGDYSAAGSFTTLPPPPAPAIPSLVSPGAPDGGTIPSIDTLKPPFSWNAVPEATSYRIQISRNVGFTSLMINTTTTAPSYSLVAALTANAQYWWKVQAINSSGPGAWSTVYTFRTLPIPAAPILLSPANGATVSGVRPTLDWDDVPNATSYHLLVGTNSWFGIKVVDVVVTDGSSFTLDRDLVPGTTYYWRLTATSGVGTSGWSATWSFKVTP